MNPDIITRDLGFGEIINHNFGGPSESMIKILETFKYREFSGSCQKVTSSGAL